MRRRFNWTLPQEVIVEVEIAAMRSRVIIKMADCQYGTGVSDSELAAPKLSLSLSFASNVRHTPKLGGFTGTQTPQRRQMRRLQLSSDGHPLHVRRLSVCRAAAQYFLNVFKRC